MKMARISIIILMVFLMTSCSEDQRAWLARFFKVGGSAVPVAVEKVAMQERDIKVTVPATLAPSEQAEVRIPFEAHIDRVFVKVGDIVKAGTALCHLSEEYINLRLASLRADLQEAQATLEKNQYFLRNRDRLLEEGRIDKNQYDNLESEVTANEGAAERLRTQISTIEGQLGTVNVTSPTAGMIQSVIAQPGMAVTEKQPLFVITKVDPISVVFALAPYEAKGVQPNTPVQVRFRELPGEAVTAVISSVGTEVNSETGRFDMRAQLPNPAGTYKVGMVGQVEFAGAEKQKFFSVPAEAVITENRRHYVFTVSKGVAHKVQVIPREIRADFAEIVEGLADGDLVVVKGNKQLKEGSVVDMWGR